MRNMFVDYRCGASTRGGTKFVIQAFKSATAVRLISFQTSAAVPYMLEFGDGYIRFMQNGASVLETSFNITAASQANPGVLTVPGNNFVTGDWAYILNVGGMTRLNGQFVKVTVAGAAVTLADVNGNLINTLSYSAYTSGGTIARVYTITSPYAAADLALLKFVQQTNTMYLTHPAYAPRTLIFTAATSWALAAITFGTTILPPTGLSGGATAAGTANYAFVVTSVDATGQESTPSAQFDILLAVNITNTAGTLNVNWVAATGAVSYNVYKAELSMAGVIAAGASFGFIGFATGTNFVDSNIVPDFSQTPPIVANPFTGNNPGTACFFQQRLYFGGSTAFPQTFWASQPGQYLNFNISDPTQADDAITDTIVSKQVNAIKSLTPMPGGLIFLTATGAWQVSAGSGVASTTAVTPINITAAAQAYNGSTDLPPIVANFDVLYVQPDGIVRDLSFNIYASIYTGTDISVLSNHLFFGYSLREWAWAELPYKIVWAIRNDGTLLSLTYVKEQELIGWARHDTLGLFQSVATVLEGQYNAVYVVVKRFIAGAWVQMIERMDNRITFPYGAEDAWAVDCGIQSTLPTPAADLTADVSIGTVIFTASAAVFSSANNGAVLRMGGGIANAITFISGTKVSGTWIQSPLTVPNDPANTPLPVLSGTWSITTPSTTFSGLDYLNGQVVSILADGSVVASQTVAAGSITLPQPATKVTVGLAFTAQLQTMYLDLGNEKDTIQGKRKKLNAITARVYNTRGLEVGPRFDMLTPIKEMNPSVALGSAIPLVSADEWITLDSLWSVEGQVCFQQTNPLPATVLGVIPEITVGDSPGKQ